MAKRDLNSHGAVYLRTWCEHAYVLLQKYYHAWQRHCPSVSLRGGHTVSGVSTMPNRSENYEFQNKPGPKSFKEEEGTSDTRSIFPKLLSFFAEFTIFWYVHIVHIIQFSSTCLHHFYLNKIIFLKEYLISTIKAKLLKGLPSIKKRDSEGFQRCERYSGTKLRLSSSIIRKTKLKRKYLPYKVICCDLLLGWYTIARIYCPQSYVSCILGDLPRTHHHPGRQVTTLLRQ